VPPRTSRPSTSCRARRRRRSPPTRPSIALDEAIAGLLEVDVSAGGTITVDPAAALQCKMLRPTGTLAADVEVVVPDDRKPYFVRNATTGGFAVAVRTAAAWRRRGRRQPRQHRDGLLRWRGRADRAERHRHHAPQHRRHTCQSRRRDRRHLRLDHDRRLGSRGLQRAPLQRRTAAASPVGTARSRPIARANLLTALAKSGDSVTRHSTRPGNPDLGSVCDAQARTEVPDPGELDRTARTDLAKKWAIMPGRAGADPDVTAGLFREPRAR
jgi:hypothetical protein